MNEKHCSKCRRLLPAAMFNKAKWLKSGLRSDCKECYSAVKKARWAAQPKSGQALRQSENAELRKRGLRRCKTCEQIKPHDTEHFAAAAGGRLQVGCRECDRKRMRQWANDNSERYKANAAAGWASRYAAKQRRTMSLSPEHGRQIKEIYAECRKLNERASRAWHVDHIVPLNGKTVSGLHVPWNLRIVPAEENVRKAAKWMNEESCLSGVATAA